MEKPANEYHKDAGTPKAHKNINTLTSEELARLRAALAQMKSLDAGFQDERSFAYWARIHGNYCQHGWEEFLPWRRPYLAYFEQQLQDIDPSVTLPYWDWTDNYDPNVTASLFDAAQTDPTATVALVEGSSENACPRGESLAPGCADLLRSLGCWDRFGAENFLESYGRRAWGADDAQ